MLNYRIKYSLSIVDNAENIGSNYKVFYHIYMIIYIYIYNHVYIMITQSQWNKPAKFVFGFNCTDIRVFGKFAIFIYVIAACEI